MFLLFFSFYIFFVNFKKKLLCLLSLEISMILLISNFFFSFSSSLGFTSFFFMFILLCFMVLDSVLGISLLIGSSRVSNQFFLLKSIY